jgi:hypothetical protein
VLLPLPCAVLQLYFSSEWASLLEVSFRNFIAGMSRLDVCLPCRGVCTIMRCAVLHTVLLCCALLLINILTMTCCAFTWRVGTGVVRSLPLPAVLRFNTDRRLRLALQQQVRGLVGLWPFVRLGPSQLASDRA